MRDCCVIVVVVVVVVVVAVANVLVPDAPILVSNLH